MEPESSTEIIEEKPAKPAGKRRLWIFLALGGGILAAAVILLALAFRAPAGSNLPELSPDDLEQQKYDTQQTQSDENKAARLRNQPFVVRKEDAQVAAQLKGMMNELQLERGPNEPQTNTQLKA